MRACCPRYSECTCRMHLCCSVSPIYSRLHGWLRRLRWLRIFAQIESGITRLLFDMLWKYSSTDLVVSTVLVKTKGKHNNTVHFWSSLKGQVRKKVCYFSKWVVAYRPEQWTGLRLHIIRKTTFFPSIIKQENHCQNSFILKIYRHHFKGVYGPFNRRPICGG